MVKQHNIFRFPFSFLRSPWCVRFVLVASFLETKERRLLLLISLSLSVRVTDGGHGAHTALSRAEQNILGAFFYLSFFLTGGRVLTWCLAIRLEDSSSGGQSLNVEGVEYEHVMIIFGQRDDVPLGGDFETAAARYLQQTIVTVAADQFRQTRTVDLTFTYGHSYSDCSWPSLL